MPLQSSEGSFEEIHEFVSVVFAAYSDPYHPFVAILLPGIGISDPEVYKLGQHDAADRFSKGWKASPSERWVKVVDMKTNEIIR